VSAAARTPLAVTCKQTRCARMVPTTERRHSFQELTGALPGVGGTCRACGADVVDWEPCHANDPLSVERLVVEMRKELIRDVYWGKALPERIVTLALRRDPQALRESQRRMLVRELVPAEPENPWLRRHTYFATHRDARMVHCAQHATATCCRRCLELWHGIPHERRLTDQELSYLESLTWLYTTERLAEPMLTGARDG
jgi:Domain of unknown function (DUF4186)